MKFRSNHRSPPHLDRRLQLRMLGFVGLIALVWFAWQALHIAIQPPDAARSRANSLNDVDFSVEDDTLSKLKDDEIRIVPRTPVSKLGGGGAKLAGVEIDPAWLTNVDDQTVGIRSEEADAFYKILAHAATVPARELRAAAVPHVYYANLMSAPEEFRGRPIALVGELRRLRQIPVPKGVVGLDALYEAWICTSDSGENPYRVVCSRIPDELKPHESVRIPVKITAYFFKKEGYQTEDLRLHVAPTLLAGQLSLYVSPHSAPQVEDLVPWMIGVISVIGLAMLATVIGFAIGDARGRNRTSSPAQASLDTAALLQADRRPSIEESLRRLEDAANEDETANANWQSNGESLHDDESSDVEMPTPFPPTRVPPRWDADS